MDVSQPSFIAFMLQEFMTAYNRSTSLVKDEYSVSNHLSGPLYSSKTIYISRPSKLQMNKELCRVA